MLCDILVLEINLNKNFQTCTTMAPLGNPVELFRKGSTLDRDQSVKRIAFLLL